MSLSSERMRGLWKLALKSALNSWPKAKWMEIVTVLHRYVCVLWGKSADLVCPLLKRGQSHFSLMPDTKSLEQNKKMNFQELFISVLSSVPLYTRGLHNIIYCLCCNKKKCKWRQKQQGCSFSAYKAKAIKITDKPWFSSSIFQHYYVGNPPCGPSDCWLYHCTWLCESVWACVWAHINRV